MSPTFPPPQPPDAPRRGRAVAGGGVFDVVVVGAGFGGLATALALAERGVRVLQCEALNYPGGCASTFQRGGHRYEAGATLFSGFGEGQLLRRWIDAHRMPVEIDWLDPVVELRAPGLTLAIPPRRDELVERLCGLPGAPAARLRDFFAEQSRVADLLWALFDGPELLPPFGVRELLRHLARTPRYLELARLLGRPLRKVVARHGLEDFTPLTTYLDAVCQITVQAGLAEAEAPFALSAMDYYFRGTGHVRGGIGRLAWEMVRAIRRSGGQVALPERVREMHPVRGGWRVLTRNREVHTRVVVANLLPRALRQLAPVPPSAEARLDRLQARVEEGWGAAILYLVVRTGAAQPPGAHHLEIVQDPSAPFVEGNHLFCSVGASGEQKDPAHRTVTVSTHVPLQRFLRLPADQQAREARRIQDRMRQGLQRFAPELWGALIHQMTASPRTFERFTRRPGGYVGGIPRRAGLGHYADLLPRPAARGLYLVGDTVFPGQSTLAVSVGGLKLAEHLVSSLG